MATRSQASRLVRPLSSRISTPRTPWPPSTRVTTAPAMMRAPVLSASAATAGAMLGRGSTSAATSTPAAARSAITPAAVVVIGEDDRAPAGQRGEAVDIGADRAGEHHARPVVVAEHQWALDRAGGQHAALGDDAPGSLARLEGWRHRHMVVDPLERPVGAVIVDAEQGGAGHHPHVRETTKLRLDALHEGNRRLAAEHVSLGEEPAAEAEILFAKDHAGARAGGGERRHQARGPRADDEHVAEGMRLLVRVGIGADGRPSEPGRASDQRFVDLLPEGGGPHEGLVVEARRQDRGEDGARRHQVEGERRPAILAFGGKALEELDRSRARIRLAPRPGAQLDERVRLFRPRRQDAARAVVFEGAPDEPHPVGDQRGGERIAGMARELAAVEGEGQDARAIDQAAARETGRLRKARRVRSRVDPLQGLSHAPARGRHGISAPALCATALSRAASAPKISWVRVSRVTTSQARQPPA